MMYRHGRRLYYPVEELVDIQHVNAPTGFKERLIDQTLSRAGGRYLFVDGGKQRLDFIRCLEEKASVVFVNGTVSTQIINGLARACQSISFSALPLSNKIFSRSFLAATCGPNF